MTRVFIRDGYHCGQHDIVAEEYVEQFEATVLFGRTHETGLLNHAWINAKLRLFLLSGATGIGKTALLRHWLHTLQKKHWHDAEAVFFWSFYPPDLTQPLQDPVEEFFRHALYWFGGEESANVPNLLQGEHLATLIQAHHTLLILDGLETLQFKTGSAVNQVGDPRLNRLLERLAEHNHGLCVVVSRAPLQLNVEAEGIQRHELEKLPVDAAAAYLSYKGVQGDTDKLRQIAVDYGQNPLTLNLLGGYLSVWHSGNWLQMEKIPVLMDQHADGRQARRILVANASKLHGKPGESILYLLSLLYRPIHQDTLETLLGNPRVRLRLPFGWFSKFQQDHYAHVIGKFQHLGQRKRQETLQQLQTLGLLEQSEHCLALPQWVREAYQRQLRFDLPVTWKETNQRLMSFFKALPKTSMTDDLSSITPLILTHKSVKVAEPFNKWLPAPPETHALPLITAEITAVEPVSTDTNVQQPAIPAPPAAPPITLAPSDNKPIFDRTDLNNMLELMTQLTRYQNTLHTLQIRTKKYQRHIKQLDKEVQVIT